MARSRAPKFKQSRRFGFDIFGTGGAQLARRLDTPPGGSPGARQGPQRRRQTEYSRQLFEKQKVKAIYGVLERQFSRYIDEAEHSSHHTPAGTTLLTLLERRLDNVVYRLGLARSRPMARQLVGHGHVLVNGRRVDIPSFRVRPGMTVTLSAVALKMVTVEEELASGRLVPQWLRREGTTGHVVSQPERADVELPIDERLVIAFYSRR
ncbi:MAG: 30S ribosomal protein S4 [Chloroflexi bacterium]|nr:30S ribosomal protein S4 [Chloroflexota bacterium]